MHSLGKNVCLTLLLASAQAARGEGVPSAKAWAASYLEKVGELDAKSLGSIRNVTFVQGFDKTGEPVFAKIDRAGVSGLSFFEVSSWIDARLTLQFNRKDGSEATTPESSTRELFRLLGTDAVVVTEGDAWSLLLQTKDGPKTIVKAPKASDAKPESIARWLQSAVGYDGVVLEAAQGYYLIAGATSLLDKGRQGVIVADSAKREVVLQDTSRAAAIVEIEDVAGGFAVARRVIARDSDGKGGGIEPGAKIQFPLDP